MQSSTSKREIKFRWRMDMRDQSRGNNSKDWLCVRLQTGKPVKSSVAMGIQSVREEASRRKEGKQLRPESETNMVVQPGRGA